MEIRPQFQAEAYGMAAVMELKERYANQGFSVEEEKRIGEYRCDLYVEKGCVKLAFDVKAGKIHRYERVKQEAMRKYLQEQGIHYRVVIAPRPVQRHIHVEGIEDTIFRSFMHSVPSELDSLSTHTIPQEVEEANITDISIDRSGKILISGNSEVIVDLEYDYQSDEELMYTESIPFTFSGIWLLNEEGKLEIEEYKKLEFDTSSFDS